MRVTVLEDNAGERQHTVVEQYYVVCVNYCKIGMIFVYVARKQLVLLVGTL